MVKKAVILTRPTPALRFLPTRPPIAAQSFTRDAPFRRRGRSEVRDAKNNEAHGAMDKEHHVCARQRVGERPVSSKLADFFNILLHQRAGGGKLGKTVMIQNICDRVPHFAHGVLQGTVRLAGIRTIATFLIGGLADAGNRGQRSVKNADDLSECYFVGGLDQRVAATDLRSTAREQSCSFQGEEDLFQKLDGNILPLGDLMSLQDRPLVGAL